MKVIRKHLKALALSLLVLFFVTTAHSNASALGTYRTTTLPSNSSQLQTEAAFPALAAYGLIVVGAFVIGAVNGYYERQSAVNGGNEAELASRNYNSGDFSSFDN